MWLNIFLYSLTIIILINTNSSSTADIKSEYGYGFFEIYKFEAKSCDKLMKPMIYSNVSFRAISAKDGRPILFMNLTVTHDIGPLMGKIVVNRVADGKLIKVLSINQDNVCKYAFPLKLLPFTLKVDNKCIVKPGSYLDQPIDIQTMVSGFVGKKFVFGKFKVQVEWFSKKYMGVCVECLVESRERASGR